MSSGFFKVTPKQEPAKKPNQEPEERSAAPLAPKLEWIDSHTHLEHEYPFSVDEYLASARAQGVRAFITIGTEPEKFARLKDHAELYPDVFFTVGIHPHEAKFLDASVEAEMESLRTHPKCVAIGETGLDYFYDHSPRDAQLRALRRQLELAREWRKPVVIHARDAEDDLLRELSAHAAAIHADAPHGGGVPANSSPTDGNRSYPEIGVIHCFSGTRHFAEECLKLGFYISFSGILTFKTAGELRAIARDVPLERVLVETDSPFLAPVPYRGKPNQSAYMIETAKVLAQAKSVTIEELSRATVANTRKLFSLPDLL